ncbi:SCP-like protein, partial [Ancylostoma caninum]
MHANFRNKDTISLQKYKDFRAVVARNAPAAGEKVVQRPASQMKQMRNYDCALEYAAYLTASRCSATDDSANSPANNENQYIARSSNAAPLDAAKEAIKSWFGEIKRNKMPQGAGQKNLYSSRLGIPHGARFIWETHTTIGCAIAKCSTFFKVVCYYSPELASVGPLLLKGPVFALYSEFCCRNMENR